MEPGNSKDTHKVRVMSCRKAKMSDLAVALFSTEPKQDEGPEPVKVESPPVAPEASQDVDKKDTESPSSTSLASADASTSQGISSQPPAVPEDTSIPVWNRKALPQMTAEELVEYFEHICDDAHDCIGQAAEEELGEGVAGMRAAATALGHAFRGQLQQLIQRSGPLQSDCFRLVRQLNFFDPQDPEDEEIVRDANRRYPVVDVFAHRGFIFLSVHPTRGGATYVTVKGIPHIFPHYCLEVTPPLDANSAACILRSFIDNFHRFRLETEGGPQNRFSKDFQCFLTFINDRGDVYEIAASRICFL